MSSKTPASPSVQTPKPSPTIERKSVKTSPWRHEYKQNKFRLKRLIEEGILLQEKLRRKQEKLAEMSRDIHYVLGRLLPYEKKLAASCTKSKEELTASSESPPTEHAAEVKSEQERLAWEGFDACPPSNNTNDKHHMNLGLSAEMERQLASMVSDRETLTLPDNIFSET